MALLFWQFILIPILAPHVSMLIVICFIIASAWLSAAQMSSAKSMSPLLGSLDSKTDVVYRFSHDKVDGDEDDKMEENATLPHACLSTIQYNTMQHDKIQYNIIQYNTI